MDLEAELDLDLEEVEAALADSPEVVVVLGEAVPRAPGNHGRDHWVWEELSGANYIY